MPEAVVEIGLSAPEAAQTAGEAWGSPGNWMEKSESTGRLAIEVIGAVTPLKSVDAFVEGSTALKVMADTLDAGGAITLC